MNMNSRHYSRQVLALSAKNYRKLLSLSTKISSQVSTELEELQPKQETKIQIQQSQQSQVQVQVQQPRPQSQQQYTRVCGLHNVGNTCYFNSALQCIINTPHFNDKFLTNEINSQTNPKHKNVALAYQNLLKKMRINGPPSCENPIHLKQMISQATKKFKGFRQEDSQEFLRALLTCLHEDLNRHTTKPVYKELNADLNKHSLQEISNTWFNYFKARDDSLVSDYFTGQLLSTVVCMTCKNQSIAFDNFQDLSLAFIKKGDTTLTEMLKFYLSAEDINSYTCAKCRQQRKCVRQLQLWRLPNILVIHLKRFQYNGPYRNKINHNVRFDAELDMAQFVKDSHDKSVENSKYKLYGIVKHYGDLNYGHYFAECEHPFTKKWYQLNDSSVSQIQNKTQSESDSSAYLLFYSRV